MNFKKLVFLVLLFVCIGYKTFSQSDLCSGAPNINLTAGTYTTAGNNTGFAATGEPTVRPCNNSGGAGSIQHVGWYTLTTDAHGGDLTASLTLGGMSWAALTLYANPGSCSSFSNNPAYIACDDPNSSAGAVPSFTTKCLLPNTTYYLMIWTDGNHAGTFTLNVTYTASNDCICNATSVTMNSGATIDSYSGTVAGNNSTATADGSVYCFTPNKNQYYSFTAPVAGSYYCGITPGTMTDPEIAVYKSSSCNSYTLSNCAGYDGTNIKDANHATVYTAAGTYTLPYAPFSLYSSNYTYGGVCDLTAGQTAYIMVDNYSGGTSGTYTLTVANLSNDDITNPLLITSCGSIFNGTTVGATNCGNGLGSGLQNDVDNNTATTCTNNTLVTSCGTAGAAGNACYGGATNQTDANKNGGDIGYSIENDSWYEFCVTSTCTVTITFSVNSASCLVPSSGTAALQLSAFMGSAANLTKIYGGYCLENIATSVSFSFAATAGNCYFFEVDGYSGANCPYTLQATMVPSCVLPVKLLYFTCTNEEGKTKLEWATAEEENSDKYVVERSDDGINYVPITTVRAKVNSSTRTDYVFYDDHPLLNKVNYYKLDGFDRNGAGGVLAQTFVNNTADFPKFNVYPNPSTGKFTISLHNFSVPNVLVEIFDVYGKSVWSSNIELNEGKSMQDVDFLNFDEGIYIIRTSDGDAFYKQRLIISR